MGERLKTEAIETATRAINKRLDREVIAAWRAGYDYLHFIDTPNAENWDPTHLAFNYTYRVIPSDKPRYAVEYGGHAETYDLRGLDRKTVEKFHSIGGEE